MRETRDSAEPLHVRQTSADVRRCPPLSVTVRRATAKWCVEGRKPVCGCPPESANVRARHAQESLQNETTAATKTAATLVAGKGNAPRRARNVWCARPASERGHRGAVRSTTCLAGSATPSANIAQPRCVETNQPVALPPRRRTSFAKLPPAAARPRPSPAQSCETVWTARPTGSGCGAGQFPTFLSSGLGVDIGGRPPWVCESADECPELLPSVR